MSAPPFACQMGRWRCLVLVPRALLSRRSEMIRTMRIYLAGTILKGDAITKQVDWRPVFADIISATVPIELLPAVNETLDEADALSIFGHDCMRIREADV